MDDSFPKHDTHTQEKAEAEVGGVCEGRRQKRGNQSRRTDMPPPTAPSPRTASSFSSSSRPLSMSSTASTATPKLQPPAPSPLIIASPPYKVPTTGKRKASVFLRQSSLPSTEGTQGAGERALAARLFAPTTGSVSSATAISPAKPTPPPAAPAAAGTATEKSRNVKPPANGNKNKKSAYLPLEKGRLLFRLLMASEQYKGGNWSTPPSDALAATLAAAVGCTVSEETLDR